MTDRDRIIPISDARRTKPLPARGTSGEPLHAGLAARNGVVAAQLAGAGMTDERFRILDRSSARRLAAAAREVRVSTAAVGGLAALDARLEQTVVRTVVAQRVTLGRGTLAGIVIAARTDGEGRPLLDWRGGLAAGTLHLAAEGASSLVASLRSDQVEVTLEGASTATLRRWTARMRATSSRNPKGLTT